MTIFIVGAFLAVIILAAGSAALCRAAERRQEQARQDEGRTYLELLDSRGFKPRLGEFTEDGWTDVSFPAFDGSRGFEMFAGRSHEEAAKSAWETLVEMGRVR
jgi:hypothetical protein